MHEYKITNTFMGGLPHGADLLGCLNEIVAEKGIESGSFVVIGAVKKAVIGYYDQQEQRYKDSLTFEGAMEISSLSGNISLMDGQPFCHAHALFSDRQGQTVGGHLMPGTVVYAAECIITVFAGTTLHRKLDPVTNLPLWG